MATDTRSKILDAATRLFAAADSSGASLRAIAREAKVNSALIHYHFGSREALFEAAILEALTPIQTRRKRLIEELGRTRPEPDGHDLARLFVEPLLLESDGERPRHAMQLRLLARIFSEHRPMVRDLTLKHFGELMYALGDYLGDALPGIPEDTKYRRMQFSVEAALESLASLEASDHDASERMDTISDLIDFLAGGLSAPASSTNPTQAPSRAAQKDSQ